MSKGQAERLFPLCQAVLEHAGVTVNMLDAVAVGVGPGNFTGVRIAVSAARGLAFGLEIPAIGVTAFEALRHGFDGDCICAIDARRDEVYLQTFDSAGPRAEPVLAPSASLRALDYPVVGEQGIASVYPAAVAIALVAQSRLEAPVPRPAPLYLRPADAAPARDAPPDILS